MPSKTNRNNIPLLVIGVGGTGKDIAMTIKQKFIERFNNLDNTTLLPPRTAFLVVDADTSGVGPDPHGITENENCNIVFPNLPLVFEQKSFSPEEQSWVNPNLTSVAITDGASRIRQVGRFQLFRNMPMVIDKLSKALHLILGAEAYNPPKHFSANIVICGSLSGSTGSGTALDMAYIVRQLVKDHYEAYSANLKLYGMFLMPECIIQRVGSKLSGPRQNELRANAFAAMKEIDYWMRQDDHGDTLDVKYPGLLTHWNIRPFSYLGYLGHTWENGLPINNAYEVAVNKIAELFLLLSTETPQSVAGGKLAVHNVYSSLSSAGAEMLRNQNDAPYPVSAWAMSLGTSEYSSFENDIQNYEIQKTLNQVLTVQLFNPSNGEMVTEQEARINSIPAVVGTLGLADVQDAFFQNLVLETESEDDFRAHPAYQFTDKMFTREAIEMAGASYVADIRTFHMNQQTQANEYYRNRFVKVWSNFREEARKAIITIQCGPIGFLHFLDEVYIPDVSSTLEDARNISAENDEGRQSANQFADLAAKNYEFLADILHPGLSPQKLIAAARWNDYVATYRDNLENLSAHEWDWRCMAGKVIALTDYLAQLTNYRNNLSLIIDTVRKQEERLATTTDQEINEGSLLTFDQLRNYLEGVNLPDAGIAKARDQVLKQIAELSFDLPRVDLAESFEEQNRLFQSFTKKVRGFVQACFTDQNLTNMDRVLDAAVAGSNETAQNYMANTVAPKLARAAQPMLHLDNAARAIPAQSYEYHHIFVPEDAPTMIAGLNQYKSGPGIYEYQTNYSKCSINDRMLIISLKMGIPLYMMADTSKLMECYEKELSNTTNPVSQGIHLVGTNQINSLSDVSNALDKSWRRMPCPLPPVEVEDKLSPMQKSNLEYLKKRFCEAVESSIITFAGEDGAPAYTPGSPDGTYSRETFVVHDFVADEATGTAGRATLDEIFSVIDAVKNDSCLSTEERIIKLQKMRTGKPVKSIHYGKYMFNYANALRMIPIQPSPGDQSEAREAGAKRYEETRLRLCSYMLGLYPRLLDLIEKNLLFFEYLRQAEQYLAVKLEKRSYLYKIADEYCMLFVGDIIYRKADWFVLVGKEKNLRIFQNDFRVMSIQDMVSYPEQAFLLQLDENLPRISKDVIDQIEAEKKNYPADALAIEERKMTETIKPMLDAKIAKWENCLMLIKDTTIPQSGPQKETMQSIYERLLQKAKAVKKALE